MISAPPQGGFKSIEPDDYAPFTQRGGLGKAHQLFGEQPLDALR